jgi:hypothetical protein
MKGYIVSVIIVVASIISLAISVKSCRNLKQENKRLESNQDVLLEDITFYKTKDSLNVASVKQLELTNAEFKKYNSDLVAEVEKLKLKVKNIQSVSRTSTITLYDIEPEWRDSIIYRDGRIDTIRCVSYEDDYLSFYLCEEDSVTKSKMLINDTIIQFVYTVPKQWLFFKWGVKAIRQDIFSKNPNTKINYTEYISLKKRKKK